MGWYVVQTKPRQEHRALLNLEQQGYRCFLPLFPVEKILQQKLVLIEEPLFPRYLFICLDPNLTGKSWMPIRSTLGVSHLVSFEQQPVKVDPSLIDLLKLHDEQLRTNPNPLSNSGQSLVTNDGLFAGIQAVYQMTEGVSRALVLIEFLSRLRIKRIELSNLRKLG